MRRISLALCVVLPLGLLVWILWVYRSLPDKQLDNLVTFAVTLAATFVGVFAASYVASLYDAHKEREEFLALLGFTKRNAEESLKQVNRCLFNMDWEHDEEMRQFLDGHPFPATLAFDSLHLNPVFIKCASPIACSVMTKERIKSYQFLTMIGNPDLALDRRRDSLRLYQMALEYVAGVVEAEENYAHRRISLEQLAQQELKLSGRPTGSWGNGL